MLQLQWVSLCKSRLSTGVFQGGWRLEFHTRIAQGASPRSHTLKCSSPHQYSTPASLRQKLTVRRPSPMSHLSNQLSTPALLAKQSTLLPGLSIRASENHRVRIELFWTSLSTKTETAPFLWSPHPINSTRVRPRRNVLGSTTPVPPCKLSSEPFSSSPLPPLVTVIRILATPPLNHFLQLVTNQTTQAQLRE